MKNTRYDGRTLEHLLISFSKQAVNGLCASEERKKYSKPEQIAELAFDIGEACIKELTERLDKLGVKPEHAND